MRNSTRILHIASGDVWGGAESQLFNLVRALGKNSDFDNAVITFNHGLLAERLGDAGITCRVIDESKHNAYQLWQALRREIINTSPDIVHTHGYKQNVLGSLAAVTHAGCLCIRTQHGAWEISARLISSSSVFRKLDMLSAQFLQSCIIAVSESLATMLERHLPSDKIVVIENGVDTETLASSSSENIDRPQHNNFVIAFVGRIVPVKRIDLFLEAAAIILKQNKGSVSFRVFGDGPVQLEAAALAERLGIADSVRFYGFVPDVAEHLASCDLLMMTSDHEGLPMVLLEALYLKVPVVAPAVGGITNVLSADYGALVSEQNPKSYADSVISCIERGLSLSASMERAPAFIEQQYSASCQAQAYQQLYQQLVNRS